MEDWQKRYRRVVLDFIGAPQDVDLETVVIDATREDGNMYSTYTYEDPKMEMTISYVLTTDIETKYGWRKVKAGERMHRTLYKEEVAALIRSFS
jgi:hypothetical protein